MISSVLIDAEKENLRTLQIKLSKYCPFVEIKGLASSLKTGYQMVADEQPDLVFLETQLLEKSEPKLLNYSKKYDFEYIFIASVESLASYAFENQAVGFMLKPIRKYNLITTVKNAQKRIEEKIRYYDQQKVLKALCRQLASNDLIGIPTMEGLEFVTTNSIIRCEGLQKCTRVITVDRSDIISSYNLGEFRKILEDYGFYCPHKSHLINLRQIRKYYKEGTLIMSDGSHVPVAKRRKRSFLNKITHL